MGTEAEHLAALEDIRKRRSEYVKPKITSDNRAIEHGRELTSLANEIFHLKQLLKVQGR